MLSINKKELLTEYTKSIVDAVLLRKAIQQIAGRLNLAIGDSASQSGIDTILEHIDGLNNRIDYLEEKLYDLSYEQSLKE